MGDKELMTLQEAAARVNVKPKSLWAAISRGRLQATKKGRDWFVTPKALEDWQKNQRHNGGRPRKEST